MKLAQLGRYSKLFLFKKKKCANSSKMRLYHVSVLDSPYTLHLIVSSSKLYN